MAFTSRVLAYGAVLLLSLVIAVVDGQRAFCGEPPPVWRNSNRTCPDRAICADVFETVRDWYNGTSCEEKRTLHNCMCEGGTICPYRDPNHMLHASKNHKEFICRPVCSLPWCNNVQFQQAPNPSGRVEPVVSLTVEQRAREFGMRTYYKMQCRCPRHHNPFMQGRGMYRSVRAFGNRYNYSLRRYSTLYTCAYPVRGLEEEINDPCGNLGVGAL